MTYVLILVLEMQLVLVTGEKFVSAEDERLLGMAGFRVQRTGADLSESQLCETVGDITGYVLGGDERITQAVLECAPQLRAIVFTGAGYQSFIPAHQQATARGIAIANVPGGNASAVARFAVTLAMMFVRRVLDRTGERNAPAPVTDIDDMRVGIIGAGAIGGLVMSYFHALGAREITYFSRNRKMELERLIPATYLPLEQLLATSDVISLHLSPAAGSPFLGPELVQRIKTGAIVVNAAYGTAVDAAALYEAAVSRAVRVIWDGAAPNDDWKTLAMSQFYSSGSQCAYDTSHANREIGTRAVRSLINLLTVGTDDGLVNPDYRAHRR